MLNFESASRIQTERKGTQWISKIFLAITLYSVYYKDQLLASKYLNFPATLCGVTDISGDFVITLNNRSFMQVDTMHKHHR